MSAGCPLIVRYGHGDVKAKVDRGGAGRAPWASGSWSTSRRRRSDIGRWGRGRSGC